MSVSVLQLVSGFVFLAWGASHLVTAVENISLKLKLPLYFLSITLIALGTSLAELVVSLIGLRDGLPETVVGNILGSNLANLGLALGLCALVGTIKLEHNDYFIIKAQQLVTCLFALVIFVLEEINLTLSLVMITAMILILRHQHQKSGPEPSNASTAGHSSSLIMSLELVAGSLALWAGSELVIPAALKIGNNVGINYATMSVLVLALGTSLPEIVTSIIAVFRKQPTVIIGCVVGSNLMNLLIVGGVSGLVETIPFAISVWGYDLLVVLLMSSVFSVQIILKGAITRNAGLLLVSIYLANLAFKLWSNLGN